MELSRITRTSLGLILGVVAGLGLVILPGVIAPSSPTTISSGNTRSPAGFTANFGPAMAQPANTPPSFTIISIVIPLVLIVFPAVVLGLLARYQMIRRTKD